MDRESAPVCVGRWYDSATTLLTGSEVDMVTVIKNATVITGDAGRTVHHDGAVAVDGDRIVGIGPTNLVLAAHPGAEQVAGAGKAVFPGLVNCHTHLLATADRGILEDFGFPTVLEFPVSARSLMTPEEQQVMAVLGALEAIRSGTTCLLEISAGVQGYAPHLERTGLRLVLAENINDVDEARVREGVFEFGERRLDEGLERSANLIEKWHGGAEGRVSCFMAPHAPETCSPALLRRSREMAESYGVGYTIHLSQSHDEVEAVMRVRGVAPTQYLFVNDFLGPRLVAAHCRYVTASEVAVLGQTGTGVSNNAAIAARRGAAAPVKELQAAGCGIGMGSDNMAEDMVEVMRAGLFLERVRRNDQVDPQPEDVLQWATQGGANILGLGTEIGALEVGKKADLFMIDMLRPHLVPTLRIVSAFVHNGQPADITSVMVDGRWVMRDGKVLTVDEDDVVRRAEQIGHAVWRRLLDRYPNVPFPVTLPPPGA
ncbi:MAG: amidohydrolase family protein [Chloroflexi bacterium]|nr:amidohydrolase family protein [Chloroflexota bacterium]